MGQRHFWQRSPDPTLFQVEHWLGSKPQSSIDSLDYHAVWKRLLRWQQRIGHLGDPIPPKLSQDIAASLQLTKPDLTKEQMIQELDLLRARVLATLIPVERAYLLNTTWTLCKTSTLVTGFDVTCWDLFIKSVRKHAYDLDLTMYYEFVRPRLVDGIAGVRVEGNAHQLQDLVNRCYGAIGINLASLASQEYMREIPTFASAQMLRHALVEVPEVALRKE